MEHSEESSGVVVPPPLIYLSMLLMACLLDFYVCRLPLGLSSDWRRTVAAALAAAAVPLLAGALGGFRRAGTRPEPWKPSTAIVRTGVYRLTRNPMYMAMMLVYLALAVALDSGIAVLFAAPLLLVIQQGVVRREERYLERTFGEEYLEYKRSVRRWI